MKNLKRYGSFLTEEKSGYKGFHTNIETDTIENNDYRNVIYTAESMQLVLMSIKVGGEIGEEVHKESDQFFRFEKGIGKCIIDSTEYDVKDGDVIVVPQGAKHNVINTGEADLKLYAIYAPPHHEDGVVRKTKGEADDPANAEEFTGETTE